MKVLYKEIKECNEFMTEVFISYSRKDQDFVRRLFEALSKNNRDAWVDWDSIPTGRDFFAEIYAGIEQANTFLLIVTSSSLTSEICNLEIQHAIEHNKRIIPVIREELQIETIAGYWFDKTWEQIARSNWQTVKHLNWLFFRDQDVFEKSFSTLIEALDIDIEYVKEHTRVMIRAREWENSGQKGGYLLKGEELERVEHWYTASRSKAPRPTKLQTQYILASVAESQRIQEEELAKQATLQAQKEEFITRAAYELRTPISALLVYLNLISSDETNIAKYLERVNSTAKHMQHIVMDLLDLSRVDNMRLAFKREDVVIQDIIEEVIQDVRLEADRKSVDIVWGKGTPIVTFADRTKMRQVITTTIHNAVKFSLEHGKVYVEQQIINNGEQVQIVIRNTGLEISEKDLPHVFDRFFKGKNAREASGSGLGLSIAKEIVEHHGGTISLANDDIGVVLTICIPANLQGLNGAIN